MNPIVFVIALWLCVGLDLGLADAFQIGSYDIAPSFAIILLAYVAAWAPLHAALGWALVTGIVLDLVSSVTLRDGSTTAVLGPHALGCVASTYFIITIRALMFRRNVLAISFLSFMAALIVSVIVVFTMSVRAQLDSSIEYPGPLRALLQALFSALWTAALALPVGWALLTVRPVFAFRDASSSFPLSGSARR